MIYFTGDTHFGGPRVLRLDCRPFQNMVEHDSALIRAWNEAVGPDDDVWHLGDVMSSKAGSCDELLAKLNGCKHLIVGNNDAEPTTSSSGWKSVQHYAEIRHRGHHLIMCHYAFRTWNQMGKKSINLHGHSHGRLKALPRQFDVGMDAQRLRPVTLDDILRRKHNAGGKEFDED